MTRIFDIKNARELSYRVMPFAMPRVITVSKKPQGDVTTRTEIVEIPRDFRKNYHYRLKMLAEKKEGLRQPVIKIKSQQNTNGSLRQASWIERPNG